MYYKFFTTDALRRVYFSGVFLLNLSLVTFLLNSCSSGSDSSEPNPDASTSTVAQVEVMTQATRYFPMAVGNIWQYLVSTDDGSGNTSEKYAYRAIDNISVINNHDAYSIKRDIENLDTKKENIFYSKLTDGIYFHGAIDAVADNVLDTLSQTYLPPVLYLKSIFSINDTWSTTTTLSVDNNNGTAVGTHSVTYNVVVLAIEDVSVPAGTFSNAYKIEVDVSSSYLAAVETITFWLAENIGIIKLIRNNNNINVTQELQYSSLSETEIGQEYFASNLLGPSQYFSFADSPFNSLTPSYFHLEDFEDQTLNTLGVTALPEAAASARTQGFSGAIIDSVDGDDGAIDGLGYGSGAIMGDSFFASTGSNGITFSFDEATLNGYPTHVGIVWTDGAGTTFFEAFDANGISLGGIGPVSIADNNFLGATDEDRFFGIIQPNGISKIFISNSSGGIEVDHLQYGR